MIRTFKLLKKSNLKVLIVHTQMKFLGGAELLILELANWLTKKGIKITRIFSPEHGFRGDFEAGEKIESSVDSKTKLPVVSLYGSKSKPSADDLKMNAHRKMFGKTGFSGV